MTSPRAITMPPFALVISHPLAASAVSTDFPVEALFFNFGVLARAFCLVPWDIGMSTVTSDEMVRTVFAQAFISAAPGATVAVRVEKTATFHWEGHAFDFFCAVVW